MQTPIKEIHQEQELREVEYYIQNKNMTSMWLLLLTQLFYCFMYGFFIRVNSMAIPYSEYFVHTAFMLVLIVVGFGLALGSSYKLVWSNLGFNLLIAALSIQTFFLVNAFWTKASIYFGGSYFNIDIYNVSLVPGQSGSLVASANMNQAIKCALACIVAFSFVIGRAGLLQLYLMTTTGTVIYELARQTCLNNSAYDLGSIKIFLYGGVFGLMTSWVFNRLGRQANIINHYKNWNNRPSMILSLLGVLIIWALFPLLTRDAVVTQTLITTNTRVFTMVVAMSSAAILGIVLASFQFGFNMIIYSVIGAGVSVLSASAYISNPVYGIVFGLAAALFQFQFLFINTFLKARLGPLDPHAYVFIGQGFLGIFFQVINRQIIQTNSNLLTFTLNNVRSQYILGNGAITIGMALVLGFVIGALISCCSYHEEQDHYDDFTYWVRGDGLTINQPQVVKFEKPQDYELYVSQKKGNIKQKNVYL